MDEVSDLLKNNGYLDVTYIFTQVKTSSYFEAKEINNFYFGIQDFFSIDGHGLHERRIDRNLTTT